MYVAPPLLNSASRARLQPPWVCQARHEERPAAPSSPFPGGSESLENSLGNQWAPFCLSEFPRSKFRASLDSLPHASSREKKKPGYTSGRNSLQLSQINNTQTKLVHPGIVGFLVCETKHAEGAKGEVLEVRLFLSMCKVPLVSLRILGMCSWIEISLVFREKRASGSLNILGLCMCLWNSYRVYSQVIQLKTAS